MISSTFFHQKKVQVLWSIPAGSIQPAFWALGFQGSVDSQSGMIINLRDVMQIQEGFLRNLPSFEPADWLKQSSIFVKALPSEIPTFITSLYFPQVRVKLELHSESSRWVFEKHHFFDVGSEVLEAAVRIDLQSPDQFRSLAEEVWPRKFSSSVELEKFLAPKGEYLVKAFLRSEGFTSSNY